MAEHRILLIEHQAWLSVELGRLCIRRPQQAPVHVLPADIDVLCLHHPAITLTGQAMQVLSAAGAIILLTDEQHQPLAQVYPLLAPMRHTLRLWQQLRLHESAWRGLLWQQLVQGRLRGQAAVLRRQRRKGALFLERLAERVEPGDSSQCEGRGARHYWKHLFGADFVRGKQGASDPLNARLNYGYAVLRSLITRSLALAGLNGSLGVGHYSQQNPFNLADDLIEPWRCLVEDRVLRQWQACPQAPFDGKARKQLLEFIGAEVPLHSGGYRLPAAIERLVDGWVAVLDRLDKGDERKPQLELMEYRLWASTDGGSCG